MRATAPTDDLIDTRPRALRWLQWASVFALVGPALLLAWVGWTSYETTIQEATARLVRLAQIAHEQSQRIVETNAVISRGIASAIGTRGNDELRREQLALHRKLQTWTAGLEQLQSVWIWDEFGRPVATNLRADPPPALDVSDRAYFRWARETRSAGWYVSEPLRSRTTGQLFFDLVLRRSDAAGQFLGAVSVSLLPAYFDAFFQRQLRGEPGVTLSLLRADGVLIARHPAVPDGGTGRLAASSPLLAAMRAGLADGQVQGISSIDGAYRYVAYRRVGELPLYAVAIASRSALLQPWRRSMALLAAFTVPLAMGMAALCWFAMQRVRREHAIALAHREQYRQRVKAEEGLRQAQKMEALGRLTSGVAHDFNNLLMVVQTSVQLARALEQRGQPVGPALPPIERAVANGAQLTRQLLAVVRRQPLELRTVDLGTVIPPLVQLMASTLGRGVDVTQSCAPQLRVLVDQAELELALINLCVNAKDAMPGGGRIHIGAEVAAPPADAPPSPGWVRISVADNGHGIPDEILARVTEPFFTTKPLGKGTGLGLSQVQSFVAQCGGRLEIGRGAQGGTTVTLWLPGTAAEAPRAEAASRPVGRLRGAVLLVEDNPGIGESVSAMLREAGAAVTWHTSADQALQALEAGLAVDAVISDISLPGHCSGIDLARRLADRWPALPVVLMTGYTDRLREAVATGWRVVPKPAAPEVLIEAVLSAQARLRSAVRLDEASEAADASDALVARAGASVAPSGG